MKVFDISMFFNELDILKIRCHALADLVDFIVVVESTQTFAGHPKEPLLPLASADICLEDRRAQLITITRTENISSYDDLVNKLESCDLGDFSPPECYDLLEKIIEFPITVRQKPHLYLDRFQREACRVYISRLVSDEDIVFFSDADELPDNIPDLCTKYLSNTNDVYSLRQYQFVYFPNFYDREWYGTLMANKNQILKNSLDYYRRKSGSERINTRLFDGFHGYHLTNMGGVDMIKQKITNWGHQEYNTSYILGNLEKNISTGSDIFMRSHGSILKNVSLLDFYSPLYIDAISHSSLNPNSTFRIIKANPLIRVLQRLVLKISSLLRF